MILGVDIGYQTAKLIGLEKSGKLWHLRGMSVVSIPSNPWQADKIIYQEEIANAIQDGLRQAKPHPIRSRYAMTALPESVIFSATFATDKLPEKEMAENLPFEIAEKLAINLEEYQIDYEALKTRCQPTDTEAAGSSAKLVSKDAPTAAKEIITKQTIFAVAAKRSLIESLIELHRKAKLELAGIDIKPGAIARSVIEKDDGQARVIIDMGVGGTGVSVTEGQNLRVTATVPWGTNILGSDVTKISAADLTGKIAPVFDELSHVIRFFESRVCPALRIKEIIISGTGASIPNIKEIFAKESGLTVRLAEPFGRINTGDFPVPELLSHSFADVVGLAMRRP